MKIKVMTFREALLTVFILIVIVCLIIVTTGYLINCALVSSKPYPKAVCVAAEAGILPDML